MIREAFHRDIPEIKKIALNEIMVRGWADQAGTGVDDYTLETLIRLYIKQGFVRVYENGDLITGFFVGYSAPYLLDMKHLSIHEMMSGGEGVDKLWQEFLQWGRERKAVAAIVGCYDELSGSRFRRI